MESSTFNEGIRILSQLFQPLPSKEVLAVYFSLLKNRLTDEQFNASVDDILITRDYPTFPLPAAFLKILETRKAPEVTPKARALQALMKFKLYLDYAGENVRHYSPIFDDVVIQMVIRTIQMPDMNDTSQWQWYEKRFIEAHQNLQSGELKWPPLTNQFSTLRYVLVGDKEAILNIYGSQIEGKRIHHIPVDVSMVKWEEPI